MEWQPIETAPKDDAEILGWDGTLHYIVSYDEDWGSFLAFGEFEIPGITHWMPLPEPPST